MDKRLPSISCFTKRKDESCNVSSFPHEHNTNFNATPDRVTENCAKLPCMSTFLSSVRNKTNETYHHQDQKMQNNNIGNLSQIHDHATIFEGTVCQKIYLYTGNEEKMATVLGNTPPSSDEAKYGRRTSPTANDYEKNKAMSPVKSFTSSFDSMKTTDIVTDESCNHPHSNGKNNTEGYEYERDLASDFGFPTPYDRAVCGFNTKFVFSARQADFSTLPNEEKLIDKMVPSIAEPAQVWLSNTDFRKYEDSLNLHEIPNPAPFDATINIENAKMDQEFVTTYSSTQETNQEICLEGASHSTESNIIPSVNEDPNDYIQMTLSHNSLQPAGRSFNSYQQFYASPEQLQKHVDDEIENTETAQIEREILIHYPYPTHSQRAITVDKQYTQTIRQDNGLYQNTQIQTQLENGAIENETQQSQSDESNSLPALSSLFDRKDSPSENDGVCDELTESIVRDLLSSKGKKKDSTYIALISRAIFSSPDKKMLLSDIYDYLSKTFKLDTLNSQAWRNSVRHNLSLNECFVKHKRFGRGRGHYWSIHPACVEDFSRGDFRRRHARRLAQRHTSKGADRVSGSRIAMYTLCPGEVMDGTDPQSFEV